MIFPEGEVVHKNLSTSYTSLNGLLMSLKSEDFSGYVKMGFMDYEAVLFMDSGDIINAVEVPTARCILNRKARTMTGIINTPPPMPIMPDTIPNGKPHKI